MTERGANYTARPLTVSGRYAIWSERLHQGNRKVYVLEVSRKRNSRNMRVEDYITRSSAKN
jgi:hypothetical protein